VIGFPRPQRLAPARLPGTGAGRRVDDGVEHDFLFLFFWGLAGWP
jgi:hypothetical protein